MLGFFGMVALKLASMTRDTGVLGAYPALGLGAMAMFLVASVTEGTFGGYAYPALLWLAFALAMYSRSPVKRLATTGQGSVG